MLIAKLKYGDASEIAKLEQAAGLEPTPAPPPNEGKTSPTEPVGMERSYKGPYAKGETIKSGEKARLWEGPKPWRKK
jgi:hypothetical protein